MPRICFQLQIRPDRVEEYVRRHREVWPDMRAALSAAGWHNYSLFIAPSGAVTGYVECEDFDQARRAMEETEVNAMWQREMAPYFEGLEGKRPDEAMAPLQEIFHLD